MLSCHLQVPRIFFFLYGLTAARFEWPNRATKSTSQKHFGTNLVANIRIKLAPKNALFILTISNYISTPVGIKSAPHKPSLLVTARMVGLWPIKNFY